MSIRTNPSDRLTAGLTEAQMVTKLHARFLALIRHAAMDASETPSVTSDIGWQDLDPMSPFRPEHYAAATFQNADIAAAGTGRELEADNYATGAFTNAKVVVDAIAQRAAALRNVSGHIRTPQTHRAKEMTLRGTINVTLNGTGSGAAESHKLATVTWATHADETAADVVPATAYADTIRPVFPRNLHAYATSGGAQAIVKTQLDLSGFTVNGFQFYVVQYEYAGAAWTKANTEATNKTYAVPFHCKILNAT